MERKKERGERGKKTGEKAKKIEGRGKKGAKGCGNDGVRLDLEKFFSQRGHRLAENSAGWYRNPFPRLRHLSSLTRPYRARMGSKVRGPRVEIELP